MLIYHFAHLLLMRVTNMNFCNINCMCVFCYLFVCLEIGFYLHHYNLISVVVIDLLHFKLKPQLNGSDEMNGNFILSQSFISYKVEYYLFAYWEILQLQLSMSPDETFCVGGIRKKKWSLALTHTHTITFIINNKQAFTACWFQAITKNKDTKWHKEKIKGHDTGSVD